MKKTIIITVSFYIIFTIILYSLNTILKYNFDIKIILIAPVLASTIFFFIIKKRLLIGI